MDTAWLTLLDSEGKANFKCFFIVRHREDVMFTSALLWETFKY